MTGNEKSRAIGCRIADRRAELDLSQAALAELCGISQVSVHKIETGVTKRPRNYRAVARALGVNIQWLLDGKEPKTGGEPALSYDDLDAAIRGAYLAVRKLEPDMEPKDFADLVRAVYDELQSGGEKSAGPEALARAVLRFRGSNSDSDNPHNRDPR